MAAKPALAAIEEGQRYTVYYEFEEHLRERLQHRLGCEIDIWQDESKLRAGQKWTDEIRNAIRSSAAFIAILSRNYRSSTWCEEAAWDGADRQSRAGTRR
jgi:hypothetical protein